MPDHFIDTQLAPLAGDRDRGRGDDDAARRRARVRQRLQAPGDPRQGGRDASTCSRDGRLELGIGAGWMKTDYDALGLPYDPPAVRVDRLEEALARHQGLLGRRAVQLHGRALHDHRLRRHARSRCSSRARRSSIGGGGQRVLRLAGREADIVGINPNLRARRGRPTTRRRTRSPSRPTRRSTGSARARATRFDDIELQIRYFFAAITDDRQGLAEAVAPGFGLDAPRRRSRPAIALRRHRSTRSATSSSRGASGGA